MTEDEIAALTGFQKKQYQEASSMYKITEKQKKEAEEQKKQEEAKAAATTTAVGGTTTSSGLSAQEQQTLNNAYNAQSQSSRDRQDQAGGGGGGQFDGASSKSSYDSDPTSYSGSFAKGGRAGYFFGGRVNYKAGGRTDAGPNRTTASHSTRGQINESGQQVSGGQTTRDNNDGGNSPFYGPKPTFFNNPEILNKETILGDIPTGIGFDNSYGRYKATMDLEESLKEKGLKGELEYNNNINNFDLAAKYSSQDGPTYGVGYTGNNFDVNVNNKTGANASYSKDIGPGTFTIAGTYNPDGTYNTEARYGISFGQGKKNGGRIGFKNGGLAGLL